MWRLLKILVALTAFSWWLSTLLLSILNLAPQFFVRIYEFLFKLLFEHKNLLHEQKFPLNRYIVFLMVNTIIIVVVLLSCSDPSANTAEEPFQPPSSFLETVTKQTGTGMDTGYIDKQIGSTERPQDKHVVWEIQRDAVICMVKEMGEKERRRSTFEGKNLEELKRELRSAVGRIPRRSETVSANDEIAIKSFTGMDRLCTEEFNRRVDDFIAGQRSVWGRVNE
ncbi:hypothetical protein Vadar_017378 [Vaccinium darrowii]|uniref:Uncharacterized protein n=1 Tax=Vaccinium darrowii TaxID=229202 RepID=A0ACB7Y7M9_9ERIC|nr:hypothetical protein Vadar_017378 [Vaccinium darrowii]